MRRAIFFVFVLLTVSAVTAVASAATSKPTNRKAVSSTHKSSQSTAHRTSKTSVRHTSRRTKSSRRTSSRTKAKKTAYTPKPKSAAPTPTAGTTAYAIGYRAGYDAGHAAALKELESKNTGTTLTGQGPQPAQLPAASTQGQQAQEPSGMEPPLESSINQPKPPQHVQIDSEASNEPDNSDQTDGVKDPDEATMATLELPRPGTPISLRGSLASLQRQNTRLESEGLERILDENDLDSRIAHGLLVPLPASASLTVNPNLVENHRYCRAWTSRFLSDLAKAHAAAFHRPFQVNSAVRTVEYQKRLMRINGNAAAAEGDIVSPHLTGATIDIGKQGMTRAELHWMRRHLLALQNAGKIDVEEEFAQACFHITVYKTYTNTRPAKKLTHPPLREASVPSNPPAPTHRRGSSLPSSIAAGTLIPQSR